MKKTFAGGGGTNGQAQSLIGNPWQLENNFHILVNTD